jgi:hypothetical protein
MFRSPRPTVEPSFGHGVQEGRLRSILIAPWVAAFLLCASATTADSATFVLAYDVIGATGGYVGGTILGRFLNAPGQPPRGHKQDEEEGARECQSTDKNAYASDQMHRSSETILRFRAESGRNSCPAHLHSEPFPGSCCLDRDSGPDREPALDT